MIDLEQEEVLTLAQAAKLIPTRPNGATVYRWASRGIGGVRLETARIGGKLVTSKEAIWRFINRRSEEPVCARTQRRRREIDAAYKELERAGA